MLLRLLLTRLHHHLRQLLERVGLLLILGSLHLRVEHGLHDILQVPEVAVLRVLLAVAGVVDLLAIVVVDHPSLLVVHHGLADHFK